jgi:menaquinone-9 beta-reductase
VAVDGKVYDLVIGGGGPAGASAAITAARAGASVLLLDSSSFPRQKVCGEFVSPESLGLLRSLLGTAAHPLLDGAPELGDVDLFIDGKVVRTRLHTSARSIPRFHLDLALWQAAECAGACTLSRTSVRKVAELDGISAVQTPAGTFRARNFINAAGRWSTLNAQPDIAGERWIGIKAHFREAPALSGVQLYFFDSGYCGVQAVNGETINVCVMLRAGTHTELASILSLEPNLEKRSREWSRTTSVSSIYPAIFRAPQPVSGNILNVGDAAAFVDPFIGDGISIALQTGALAAQILTTARTRDAALEVYRRTYLQSVVPVVRRAGRVRTLLSAPKPLRAAALAAMQVGVVSEFVVRATRARALDLRHAV